MRKAVLGIVLLIMAVIGGGAFYYFGADPTTEELVAALEVAKKSNEQLIQAQKAEQNAAMALTLARQAESEAIASGDVEKRKQLAQQTRLREAELHKQTELVKLRAEEAQKAVATLERWNMCRRRERQSTQVARRDESSQEQFYSDRKLVTSCGR